MTKKLKQGNFCFLLQNRPLKFFVLRSHTSSPRNSSGSPGKYVKIAHGGLRTTPETFATILLLVQIFCLLHYPSAGVGIGVECPVNLLVNIFFLGKPDAYLMMPNILEDKEMCYKIIITFAFRLYITSLSDKFLSSPSACSEILYTFKIYRA